MYQATQRYIPGLNQRPTDEPQEPAIPKNQIPKDVSHTCTCFKTVEDIQYTCMILQ